MGHTVRTASAWTLGMGLALAVATPVGAQSANLSVSARAEAAIKVPHAALKLRAAGVPKAEVRTALVAMHHHHVPAPEVHVTLRKSIDAVHVHGPIPDFGAFVRVKLGKGLRGPKLYRSIRITHEHVARHGPPPHAKGWAKGHRLDTPGHRRHGHEVRHGPPGHRGKVDIRIRGGDKPHGPKGSVRVRGKPGRGGGHVRGHGPGRGQRGGHGRGGPGGGRGRGKH